MEPMAPNLHLAEMIANGQCAADMASTMGVQSTTALVAMLDHTPTVLAIMRMEVGIVADGWPPYAWDSVSMWW